MKTYLVLGTALVAVLAMTAGQARQTDTYVVDEAAWFQRSQDWPTSFEDPDAYAWAIDVPAVNRWVYSAVLKSTGLDVIPEGERRVWTIREHKGRPALFAYDARWPHTPGFPMTAEALAERERLLGAYAPRRAIVAMRLANVLAFGGALVCLWLAAVQVLEGRKLAAALAALPLAVNSLFQAPPTGIAWRLWSGDVYLVLFLTGGLAGLLWLARRGMAATWRGAAILGTAAGLAVSSKLTGLLFLWAVMVYLAISARGFRRLAMPALCAAVAFAVFVVMNPAFYLTGRAPWTVCQDMLTRRSTVAAVWTSGHGALSAAEALGEAVGGLWPMLFLAGLGLWFMRRAWWTLPVALWAAFLVAGSAAGMVSMGIGHDHYRAPIELAAWFLTALVMLAAATSCAAKGISSYGETKENERGQVAHAGPARDLCRGGATVAAERVDHKKDGARWPAASGTRAAATPADTLG